MLFLWRCFFQSPCCCCFFSLLEHCCPVALFRGFVVCFVFLHSVDMFIYEILPFLNAREGPAASAPAAKRDALVVEPTVSVVVVPETGVSCHSLKRNGTRDKMNAKIQSCLFFPREEDDSTVNGLCTPPFCPSLVDVPIYQFPPPSTPSEVIIMQSDSDDAAGCRTPFRADACLVCDVGWHACLVSFCPSTCGVGCYFFVFICRMSCSPWCLCKKKILF